jgi:hypothetical protein
LAIISPAQINNRALKRAWVIIWKVAKFGSPRPRAVIIIPSWLKVDRAIIFFISHSVVAPIPAIIVVDTPIKRMRGLNNQNKSRNGKNRIRRNTPPVTKVEEWTKAETGVGAAIAAGNHLEKGICALLVQAAIVIKIIWREILGVIHMCMIFQWPWSKLKAIEMRIITSPMRLVRAVIIPAPRDFGDW